MCVVFFEVWVFNKAAKVNSLGACVRSTPDSGDQTMSDGSTTKKSSDKGEKSDKGDKSDKDKYDKGPASLSIDRAAFLILRVKRAFKKKRQQRKDRQ